jgi:hypothetical protein
MVACAGQIGQHIVEHSLDVQRVRVKVRDGGLPERQRLVSKRNLRTAPETVANRAAVSRAAAHHNLPVMRALFRQLSTDREALRQADIAQLLALFESLSGSMEAYAAIRMVCFKPQSIGRISATSDEDLSKFSIFSEFLVILSAHPSVS